MSSAVRSPTSRLYLRLMYWTIASSILSPPTRTDLEKTMPASEITATSVVPPPMSTIMLPVGSVMGRPAPMAGAGRLGRLAHGALLALRHAERHADDDTGPDQGLPVVDLLDAVPEHRLGDLEVGDDPVLERPDGGDVARRAAEHPLRFGADGEHAPAALGVLLDGDDGRLIAYDALAPHEDERVRRSQVDREIVREQPEDRVEHHAARCRDELSERLERSN